MKKFSQKYYGHLPLTKKQHKTNNEWFERRMKIAEITGKNFYIPELNLHFNSKGEEVKFDYVVGIHPGIVQDTNSNAQKELVDFMRSLGGQK